MSVEIVIQIANQLAAEGKQPSVALIKSRLPAPCPMPEVIQGIQRWRSLQAVGPASEQALPAVPQAAEPVCSLPPELAPYLQPLQEEVAQLRQDVSSLREEVVMLRRLLRQQSASLG